MGKGDRIAATQTPVKRVVRKSAMLCVDGPWAGQTLYLSTKQTLWMNIDGKVGRYVKGKWEEQHAGS